MELWGPGVWTVMVGTGLLGAGAGMTGSFAVLRRQSLQGDVVSHAALAGVAGAFLVGGRNPLELLTGGAVAGWLTLWLAQRLHARSRLPLDAAQAGLMAVSFGLGLAILHHLLTSVPEAGRHPLDRYLLGQAAQLRTADVQWIATVTAICAATIACGWKQWKLLAFDPEFAAGLGLPVRRLEAGLTLMTVAIVVVGLKAVGVVLMTALLVAPSVAARQWTDRLETLVLLAGLLGAVSGVAGVWVAHAAGSREAVPTGPTIVLCASGWVAVALGTTWLRTSLQRLHLSRNRQDA